MLIEDKQTLKGRVKWTILDKDGNYENGGWWNDNLITNYGLDSYGLHWLNGIFPISRGMRSYCAVGTGSGAPAFTNTTLGNEVQRTTSNGGFPTSFNDSVTTSGDTLIYKSYVVRHFVFSNPYNLTEYGFFDTSSGGNVTIRELFRDSGNNPIQISVLENKQLKLEHEITLKVERTLVNSSFVFTELDQGRVPTGNNITVNTQERVFGTSASIFSDLLAPNSSTTLLYVNTPGQSIGINDSVSVTVVGSMSVQPYSLGSRKREKQTTLTTSSGNATFYGLAFSGGTSGYKIIFTSPTSLTKDNIHELEITFRVRWAREGEAFLP